MIGPHKKKPGASGRCCLLTPDNHGLELAWCSYFYRSLPFLSAAGCLGHSCPLVCISQLRLRISIAAANTTVPVPNLT